MEGLLTFTVHEETHVLRLPRRDFTVGSGDTTDLTFSHPDIPSYVGKFSWDEDIGTWLLEIHASAVSLVRVNGNLISAAPYPLENGSRLDFSVMQTRFNLNPDMPVLDGVEVRNFALNDQPLRIGRGDDIGDDSGRKLILDVEDGSVSRLQATIEKREDGYYIVNQGREEAELNGRFFEEDKLVIGDRFRMGLYHFEYTGSGVKRISGASAGHVTGRGLTRVVGNGRTILNNVDIDIPAGSFIGVLGRSGQGKSTLLTALCGLNPASSGKIEFDGIEAGKGERPPQIGFVPQDDIVHTDLTVRDAIRYSAQLRLVDHPPKVEIERLVEEITERLSIKEHLDKPISVLSGGQRKRVSIATELLAKPSFIFLDEPSSGLDPATEFHLMELLRDLAGSDCTVVATTHVLGRSYLFDRIIFIQDGRLIYYGQSRDSLKFFEKENLDDVYLLLDTEDPDAEEWEKRYKEEESAQSEQEVALPLLHDEGVASKGQSMSFWRSLTTLLARQKSILFSDKANLLFLLIQAVAIAALIGWVAANPGLRSFLSVVAVLWFGTSNAAQQIISELPIFRRERVSGLGLNVYLLSKVSFIFAVTGLQTLMLFLVMTLVASIVHPRPFDRETLLLDDRLATSDEFGDADETPGAGVKSLIKAFGFEEDDATRLAAPFIVAEAEESDGKASINDDGERVLVYDDGAIVRSVNQLGRSFVRDKIDLKSERARQLVTARLSPRSAPPAPPAREFISQPGQKVALGLIKFFDLQENVLDSEAKPMKDKDGEDIYDVWAPTRRLKKHSELPLWNVILVPIGMQLLSLFGSGLVGVAIGLAISSIVNSPTQAAMLVPLVLIPQILFAGFVITLPEMSQPVRSVATVIPSYAAQRVIEVGELFGQRVPRMTNATKVPNFFEYGNETVRWKVPSEDPNAEAREESEVYEKLSDSNIAFQNTIIRHEAVGERKISEVELRDGSKEREDLTKQRKDVAPYQSGMLMTNFAPAQRSGLVLVCWFLICYLVSFVCLLRKQPL